MQTGPQETAPAETDSKDKIREWDHRIQHTGDTLARCPDGHTPNVSRAAQPSHEEGQGSRSRTPNPYQDIRHCSGERNGCPSVMSPSGHTIWERALVGPQRSRQPRRPPTPPQSTSQVHPGLADDDPAGRTNKRVRAHTISCDIRLQTTAIHSESSKRMQ